MKKIILCAFVAAAFLAACSKTPAKDAPKDAKAPTEKKTSKSDESYAFGVAIGNSLKQAGITVDYSSFTKGVKDVLENKKAKMTMEEAGPIIQAAAAAAAEKKANDALDAEKKFLAENAKKPNVKTTASGLQYEVVKEGTGAKPKLTDTVKVDYTGTLLDGKKFDSSVDRGEPAVFPLDQVIPGWQEGIQLMSVGAKYKFWIPSALGYGAQGAGGVIGPNQTLQFEVDLLSAEPAKAAAPAKAPAKK